jgi:hypothetical protein
MEPLQQRGTLICSVVIVLSILLNQLSRVCSFGVATSGDPSCWISRGGIYLKLPSERMLLLLSIRLSQSLLVPSQRTSVTYLFQPSSGGCNCGDSFQLGCECSDVHVGPLRVLLINVRSENAEERGSCGRLASCTIDHATNEEVGL